MWTRKDITEKLKSLFKGSGIHYGIDMAFLYGSWAGGNPRADSDVDEYVRCLRF